MAANPLVDFSPFENRVQEGVTDGLFTSAAYTIVCAGPPRLTNVGGAKLAGLALAKGVGNFIAHPIGMVQNFNLGHNMNLARFFEVGSHRSHFVPGRVIGQFSMSRVYIYAGSLLRMMYSYYLDAQGDVKIPAVAANIAQLSKDPTLIRHDVKLPPGFENLWFNLASDVFTQPIGLLLLVKDSNNRTLGAFYLEGCYIPTHNIGTDAMGTVFQEQISVQFERMIPIRTNVVKLVTSNADLSQGQGNVVVPA